MVKMMSVTASDCKYVLFLILIYLVSSYIICNDSRESIFLKEETHSPFTQARSLIVYNYENGNIYWEVSKLIL